MTLSKKAKSIWTVICIAVACLVVKFATPAALLAANATIVGQMASSDAASLANTTVGNGQSFVLAVAHIISTLLIVFIWTRKEPSKKE